MQCSPRLRLLSEETEKTNCKRPLPLNRSWKGRHRHSKIPRNSCPVFTFAPSPMCCHSLAIILLPFSDPYESGTLRQWSIPLAYLQKPAQRPLPPGLRIAHFIGASGRQRWWLQFPLKENGRRTSPRLPILSPDIRAPHRGSLSST